MTFTLEGQSAPHPFAGPSNTVVTAPQLAQQKLGTELPSKFSALSGGGGLMRSSEITRLIHDLHFAPSLKEIETFREKVGKECGIVAAKRFCEEIAHPEDTKTAFTQLLKAYGNAETGKIKVRPLRSVLQNIGEPLSDAEFERFMRNLFPSAKEDNDEIDYLALVDRLLQPGDQGVLTRAGSDFPVRSAAFPGVALNLE